MKKARERCLLVVIWNFLLVAVLAMFAVNPVGMGVIVYLVSLTTGEEIFNLKYPYSSHVCVRLSGVLEGVTGETKINWGQSADVRNDYHCDVEFYNNVER